MEELRDCVETLDRFFLSDRRALLGIVGSIGTAGNNGAIIVAGVAQVVRRVNDDRSLCIVGRRWLCEEWFLCKVEAGCFAMFCNAIMRNMP